MSYKTPDELVLAIIKRFASQPCKNKDLGERLSYHLATVFGCSEQQAVGLCVSYGFDPDLKVWSPFRRSALG